MAFFASSAGLHLEMTPCETSRSCDVSLLYLPGQGGRVYYCYVLGLDRPLLGRRHSPALLDLPLESPLATCPQVSSTPTPPWTLCIPRHCHPDTLCCYSVFSASWRWGQGLRLRGRGLTSLLTSQRAGWQHRPPPREPLLSHLFAPADMDICPGET